MERLNDPFNDREYRTKQRNENAKRMAKTITQNLYTYLCIAIPLFLLGTVWTDFVFPSIGWGLMGDGVLTVVLMVVGERLMIKVGTFGGKLDDDYLNAKKRYEEAVKAAKERSVQLLTAFCEWQIDVEFERAKRSRCSRLRIKYEDYKEKYEGKSLEELKRLLPLDKAIAVDLINRMEPIELTPDMLLYGYSRREERHEVTVSGEEYEEKRIYGRNGLIISIVTCVVCIGLPLTFAGWPTASELIYTLGKLAALLYRMFKGYSDGARAYHTIEVRHLNSKSEYLEEYADFYDKKVYLTIANEYTQINRILGLNSSPENGDEYVKISCIEPYQERVGDGHRGSEPDRTPAEDHPGAEPRGKERRGDHDGSLSVE